MRKELKKKKKRARARQIGSDRRCGDAGFRQYW